MPNKNLFLVISMSRSGHHPIMEWVYTQFNPGKLFLNYCDFASPQDVLDNRILYHWNDRKYYTKISDSWVKYGLVDQKLKEFVRETEDVRREVINSDKNLLIMNFENLNLSQIPMPVDTFTSYFSPFKNRGCILVMRDIYNLIASRLKSGRELSREDIRQKNETFQNMISAWKSHAREFLGETNVLPDKILVNFNRWFLDANYRSELTRKLHCDREVADWHTVSTYGGGSSFDKMDLKDDARKMAVLDRWKEYRDDDIFWTAFDDPELVSLSERIFG